MLLQHAAWRSGSRPARTVSQSRPTGSPCFPHSTIGIAAELLQVSNGPHARSCVRTVGFLNSFTSCLPWSLVGLSRYASSGPFSSRSAEAICVRNVENLAEVMIEDTAGETSIGRKYSYGRWSEVRSVIASHRPGSRVTRPTSRQARSIAAFASSLPLSAISRLL